MPPSLVVQTEATEIRRSASSGYRALVHIREARCESSAREEGKRGWKRGAGSNGLNVSRYCARTEALMTVKLHHDVHVAKDPRRTVV